jgi:hypothetical protein
MQKLASSGPPVATLINQFPIMNVPWVQPQQTKKQYRTTIGLLFYENNENTPEKRTGNTRILIK